MRPAQRNVDMPVERRVITVKGAILVLSITGSNRTSPTDIKERKGNIQRGENQLRLQFFEAVVRVADTESIFVDDKYAHPDM